MNDRRPNPADPSAERTAETSAPTARGGRPKTERGRRDDETDDVIPREGEDPRPTPRQNDDANTDDPVMPTDDASLGTKI